MATDRIPLSLTNTNLLLPTTETQRTPHSLTNIAAEIRKFILEHLFNGQDVWIQLDMAGRPSIFQKQVVQPIWNILKVCKQLNMEGTPVYYKKVVLQLERNPTLTPNVLRLTARFPIAQMITINVDTNQILTVFPNVRDLTLDKDFSYGNFATLQEELKKPLPEGITFHPEAENLINDKVWRTWAVDGLLTVMMALRERSGVIKGEAKLLSVALLFRSATRCNADSCTVKFRLILDNSGAFTLEYQYEDEAKYVVKQKALEE